MGSIAAFLFEKFGFLESAMMDMKEGSKAAGPEIVFFDMDHTLMDNDCDVSWKHFLIEERLADPSENEESARHYQNYLDGIFNVESFLEFQLRQFKNRTVEEIAQLTRSHFTRFALPRIYPSAREAVNRYRRSGIPVFLLTATNEMIAAPTAAYFEMDGALCTRLETVDGRFTGRIIPPYCFKEEKIHYAQRVCESRGLNLNQAAYYGDSRADIPMLKAVGFPFAVNPGTVLREQALANRWPIEQWRLA